MEITPERLAQLEDAEAKLEALENGGVDNWEWYGEALQEYEKAKEQKEAIVLHISQADMLLYLNDHTIAPTGDTKSIAELLGIEFRDNQDECEHGWYLTSK